MKILYGLIPMILVPISANAMLDNINGKNLDTAKASKILDVDFDNNEVKNNINNKAYIPNISTTKYVSSLKGNAFESNGSKVNIPFRDMGITEADEVLTV